MKIAMVCKNQHAEEYYFILLLESENILEFLRFY